MVHGHITINVIDDPEEIRQCESPLGKPFLRLTVGDAVFDVTTNIAEMIGGAGKGVRERYEAIKKGSH